MNIIELLKSSTTENITIALNLLGVKDSNIHTYLNNSKCSIRIEIYNKRIKNIKTIYKLIDDYNLPTTYVRIKDIEENHSKGINERIPEDNVVEIIIRFLDNNFNISIYDY